MSNIKNISTIKPHWNFLWFKYWLLTPLKVGVRDLFLKMFPSQNIRNTGSFAITQHSRACKTTRYRNPCNKNWVRSETIWSKVISTYRSLKSLHSQHAYAKVRVTQTALKRSYTSSSYTASHKTEYGNLHWRLREVLCAYISYTWTDVEAASAWKHEDRMDLRRTRRSDELW